MYKSKMAHIFSSFTGIKDMHVVNNSCNFEIYYVANYRKKVEKVQRPLLLFWDRCFDMDYS
jgi:hypothetical protein